MTSEYLLTKYIIYKQFGGSKKWITLFHNGVMFPGEYIQHNIPIIYQGKEIFLQSKAEELATLYAKCSETEYIKNNLFNKNFWHDWKKVLEIKEIISLENCDFSLIYNHIVEEKQRKKDMSDEEKDRVKFEKQQLEEKYKYAYVDGKQQMVGNFHVEPTGIFIGRGCHPKLGKVKSRIYPEAITLNLSKEAPIPETLAGHKWKKIIHDKNVEWLASWKDNITNKIKYVWLSDKSDFKIKSDISKFDKAKKLKTKIKYIREVNNKNLINANKQIRQIATVLYFIDKLALRVGNEKGEDTSDTVGVTSLRIEHILLQDDEKITLDFLGKDSVRYLNTFIVDGQIYKNIKEFTEDKNKDDNIFDLINSNDINKYLETFMKGLTAKVFRTFNASYLFQKDLNAINIKYEKYDKPDKINILLTEFNKANARVAVLCNHQKNISKSFDVQVNKIKETVKEYIKEIEKLEKEEQTDKIKTKINKIKDKIKKLKIKKKLKDEIKNISLGTSKINYIDPRITIAFIKKNNISIDKVFSKTLQDKFKWAFEVDENYIF
jgi:DNA topoisomerase-1